MTDIICSVLQFFTNLIVDHFPDLSVGSSQMGRYQAHLKR